MKKSLPALTGVRFFAAFYVFLFHINLLKPLFTDCKVLTSIISQGACGVNMFFVLSGFILTYNYYDKNIDIWEFILKRLAKIYPVYLAGIIISIITYKLFGPYTDSFGKVVFLNFLLAQSYFPSLSMKWFGSGSWSISTEFFFYLSFPLILKFLKRKSGLLTAILAIGGYSFSSIPGVLYHLNVISFLSSYTFPVSRIFEFFFGMTIALLIFYYRISFSAKSSVLIIIGTVILLMIRTVFLKIIPAQNLIILPGMLILFILSVGRPNLVNNLLGSRLLLFLGKISYCFYILQIPIINTLSATKFLQSYNPATYFFLIFTANTAGAIFLYYKIELPAHRFLNKKINNLYRKAKPLPL